MSDCFRGLGSRAAGSPPLRAKEPPAASIAPPGRLASQAPAVLETGSVAARAADGKALGERRWAWLKLPSWRSLRLRSAPVSSPPRHPPSGEESDVKQAGARRRPVQVLAGSKPPPRPREASLAQLGSGSFVVRGSPRLAPGALHPRTSDPEPPAAEGLLLRRGPAEEARQARQFVQDWDGPPVRSVGPCDEACRELLAHAAVVLPRCLDDVGQALAVALGGADMLAHHRRGLGAAIMAHVGRRVKGSAKQEGEASERELEAARFAMGAWRAACGDDAQVWAMMRSMLDWAAEDHRRAHAARPRITASQPRTPPELLLSRVSVLALALGGRQIGPRSLAELLRAASALQREAAHPTRGPLAPEDVAMAVAAVCGEAGGRRMGEPLCKVLLAHLCDPAAAADAEMRAAMVYHVAQELCLCQTAPPDFIARLLGQAAASPQLSLIEVGGIAWGLALHLAGVETEPYAPFLAPRAPAFEQISATLAGHTQALPLLLRERLDSAMAVVRGIVTAEPVEPVEPVESADPPAQRKSSDTGKSMESPSLTPLSATRVSASASSSGWTRSSDSQLAASSQRPSAEAETVALPDGFFAKRDRLGRLLCDEPLSLPEPAVGAETPPGKPPWHPGAKVS